MVFSFFLILCSASTAITDKTVQTESIKEQVCSLIKNRNFLVTLTIEIIHICIISAMSSNISPLLEAYDITNSVFSVFN